jgi:hypothetical protein
MDTESEEINTVFSGAILDDSCQFTFSDNEENSEDELGIIFSLTDVTCSDPQEVQQEIHLPELTTKSSYSCFTKDEGPSVEVRLIKVMLLNFNQKQTTCSVEADRPPACCFR